VAEVLAKTNQALATLETYGQRLQQVLTRLTALEFQNAVVLDDVLVVLQRAEMTTRMAAEIERDCVELGAEARLIQMQLHELVGEVPAERSMVVHDYHADGPGPRAQLALEGLQRLGGVALRVGERLAPDPIRGHLVLVRAARVERAPGRRVEQAGRVAGDWDQPGVRARADVRNAG